MGVVVFQFNFTYNTGDGLDFPGTIVCGFWSKSVVPSMLSLSQKRQHLLASSGNLLGMQIHGPLLSHSGGEAQPSVF